MDTKSKSALAGIIAAASGAWHFRMISVAAAHAPAGPFPFVPAGITLVAILLSLYWWGKAKEQQG